MAEVKKIDGESIGKMLKRFRRQVNEEDIMSAVAKKQNYKKPSDRKREHKRLREHTEKVDKIQDEKYNRSKNRNKNKIAVKSKGTMSQNKTAPIQTAPIDIKQALKDLAKIRKAHSVIKSENKLTPDIMTKLGDLAAPLLEVILESPKIILDTPGELIQFCLKRIVKSKLQLDAKETELINSGRLKTLRRERENDRLLKFNLLVSDNKPHGFIRFQKVRQDAGYYFYDIREYLRIGIEKKKPVSEEDQARGVQKSWFVTIQKVADKRIVYGIVLEPETIDLQGDIISAEEIEKAAHNFLLSCQRIGVMHKEINPQIKPIESFIAPQDMTLVGQKVKKGSWLLGVKVFDDKIWKQVIANELTGFSICGYAKTKEV